MPFLRIFLLVSILAATASIALAQTSRRDHTASIVDSDGEVGTEDVGSQESQIATLEREDQIAYFESELDFVRQHEVQPALRQVAHAQAAREAARQAGGWFPSAQQKENIRAMEDEHYRASMQLQQAKSHELAVINKMKPLYGIVSYQFMHEQRATIRSCLKQVNEMAYNQAWWSSLFNSRHESLTDLIVGFFVQWLVSYVVMYPFAALYYVGWAAPWSIYEYSSGWGDLLTAIVAWLFVVIMILLPVAAFVGGMYVLVKYYGPALQARAAERRQQRAHAFRY